MCFCNLYTFRSNSSFIKELYALFSHLRNSALVHLLIFDVEILNESLNRNIDVPEKLLRKILFIQEYSEENNLSNFSLVSIQKLLEKKVRIILKNGGKKEFFSVFDEWLSNETSPITENYKPFFPDPNLKKFLDSLRLIENYNEIVEADSDATLKGLLEEVEKAVGEEDLVVWKPDS